MVRWLLSLSLLFLIGCGSAQEEKRSVSRPFDEHVPGDPVALNRGADVPDGFRGGVHPILHGRTALEVTAHWSPTKRGQAPAIGKKFLPEELYQRFRQLRVSRKRRIYTEQEFSAFLPKSVTGVGQIWSLDSGKVAEFLKQFHPSTSMRLIAPGRRAGPNGAFGVLRAISATHLEIIFRIHAEFHVADVAWYTPGSFTGRLLVNRTSGTVDRFELKLPTDQLLNVTLTVVAPKLVFIDIVRVDRMELLGGREETGDQIDWGETIEIAEANSKLQKVFYKFSEINWVPADEALEVARKRGKPIFALVLWGALDEQSC